MQARALGQRDNGSFSVLAHLFPITSHFLLPLMCKLKKLPKYCCGKGEEKALRQVQKLENPLKRLIEISKLANPQFTAPLGSLLFIQNHSAGRSAQKPKSKFWFSSFPHILLSWVQPALPPKYKLKVTTYFLSSATLLQSPLLAVTSREDSQDTSFPPFPSTPLPC